MRRWWIALLAAAAVFGLVLLWRGGRAANDGGGVGSGPEESSAPSAPAEETSGTVDVTPPGGTLPDVLVDPSVAVTKSARTLTVSSDGEPVKTYRIALGPEDVGDKVREGDGRTPEGEFYVCTKNPESRYHRALGLSYPTEEDAVRGLADGLITKRQHNDIIKAIHQMRQPPWNTTLGGEIMIHGGGTHADWTEGCIALSDADAEELFGALPLGTPVRIDP